MNRSFIVPESMITFTRTFAREETKRLRQVARQQHAEDQARQEKEQQRQQEWQKEGLSYASAILDWAKNLRRDETGRQLIAIGKKVRSGYRDGIFFFDAKLPGLAWRGLGTSLDATWWIRMGCGASEQYVDTPKELAEAIHFDILCAACQSIKDGTVWQCIQERLLR